jgi:hypothetical protein
MAPVCDVRPAAISRITPWYSRQHDDQSEAASGIRVDTALTLIGVILTAVATFISC